MTPSCATAEPATAAAPSTDDDTVWVVSPLVAAHRGDSRITLTRVCSRSPVGLFDPDW